MAGKGDYDMAFLFSVFGVSLFLFFVYRMVAIAGAVFLGAWCLLPVFSLRLEYATLLIIVKLSSTTNYFSCLFDIFILSLR